MLNKNREHTTIPDARGEVPAESGAAGHLMQTVISGRNPVLEALKAGVRIRKIVVLDGTHGAIIDEIRARASAKRIELALLRRQSFEQLAGNTTTQGVVAFADPRTFADMNKLLLIPEQRNEAGFLLILDGIEDPHNLGALIRTAECAGVHGVIIPKHHSAPITGSVVKASAGATEHIAIAEVTNIVKTMEELKERGYWITGLDASGTKVYNGVDYETPVALVVGSEGKGIRRLVKENCDHLVRIPMKGKIGSLNASVAGALVMYEVLRQRRT